MIYVNGLVNSNIQLLTFANITFIIIPFSVLILCTQILDETEVLLQCLFAIADN